MDAGVDIDVEASLFGVTVLFDIGGGGGGAELSCPDAGATFDVAGAATCALSEDVEGYGVGGGRVGAYPAIGVTTGSGSMPPIAGVKGVFGGLPMGVPLCESVARGVYRCVGSAIGSRNATLRGGFACVCCANAL